MNRKDTDKVIRFSVGTVIKVVPYDQINTDLLGKPEEYQIVRRDGKFVTLEQFPSPTHGVPKQVITRLAEVRNPQSEGICITGYCPTFAYEYEK